MGKMISDLGQGCHETQAASRRGWNWPMKVTYFEMPMSRWGLKRVPGSRGKSAKAGRQQVKESVTVARILFICTHVCAVRASLVVQRSKRLPAMRETWARSLGGEDPLEKEMAAHSSILAWRIPWMEEPGRLQSTGSQRVRHD